MSDGGQTINTMYDGMVQYDVRGLVSVRNTFLIVEDDDAEPTPTELRRGVSEPARVPQTVEEEEEEEDDAAVLDLIPPPSKLDRLQTLESWEDIKDWQYTAAIGSDPQMPYADMSAQLGAPPPPASPPPPPQQGISLEAMAPQHAGGQGQVYFPVPGVVPPSFAQNQPVRMMQPMQPWGQQQMPIGQQPMQPMMQQQPVAPPQPSQGSGQGQGLGAWPVMP